MNNTVSHYKDIIINHIHIANDYGDKYKKLIDVVYQQDIEVDYYICKYQLQMKFILDNLELIRRHVKATLTGRDKDFLIDLTKCAEKDIMKASKEYEMSVKNKLKERDNCND